MKLLYYTGFFSLAFSGRVTAQAVSPPPAPAAAPWALGLGLGLGNGVEGHLDYRRAHWLAIGRVRGKWWEPSLGAGANKYGDDSNAKENQTEWAALLGVPVATGRSHLYAAAGLGYVSGRRTGEYRYSLRQSGLLSADATHYYAYRDYTALGVPLELGWHTFNPKGNLRMGAAAQLNLNPEQSVFCLLVTTSLNLSKPATAAAK